jgi:hypothetical protein
MKLVIVIEREELNELLAVGPKDLREHFLPKSLHIKPEDIKECWFEELQRNGKAISTHDALWSGGGYDKISHPDNFYNKEKR